METRVHVNAWVPETLKKQAFAVLQLRGQSFTGWLQARMAELVKEQKEAE